MPRVEGVVAGSCSRWLVAGGSIFLVSGVGKHAFKRIEPGEQAFAFGVGQMWYLRDHRGIGVGRVGCAGSRNCEKLLLVGGIIVSIARFSDVLSQARGTSRAYSALCSKTVESIRNQQGRDWNVWPAMDPADGNPSLR